MLRFILGLIGAAFAFVLLLSMGSDLATYFSSPSEESAEHAFHKEPKALPLASDGPFGKFNRQQLQRGFQVYKEVCAQCHSLGLVSFRELAGIGYNEAQVKKIAADWGTPQPTFNPVTGDRGTRPNLPSDKIPTVFYAGAGTPPDLTLIAKARHGGASYIHSLLTGYQLHIAKPIEPRELVAAIAGLLRVTGVG